MVFFIMNDGYFEFFVEEVKKNDMVFMDILKEFFVFYNCVCVDFKDWNIKNNVW